MRKSCELIHDREAWNRKYQRDQKQTRWKYACESHSRLSKMLTLSVKCQHQAGIDYATNAIAALEEEFPQLKNGF